MPKKHTNRRRWFEAVALAVGAAAGADAGVLKAISPGTPWTMVVGLLLSTTLSAGLPVLVFQLRHGSKDAPAASAGGAA